MKTDSALDEEVILDALRHVIDPELGCNIVDLGLIYSARHSGGTVHVQMTLTSAGCPMQASLAAGVEAALSALDGVERVDVELVFDPPWSPRLMTEEGRAVLGVYDT